jgi:hypothetical protein
MDWPPRGVYFFVKLAKAVPIQELVPRKNELESSELLPTVSVTQTLWTCLTKD